jgi:hypothetical protein
MSGALRSIRSFVSATDGWAILICLLGVASGFLPWAVPGAGATFSHNADHALGLLRWTIPSWHGIAVMVAFAGGALAMLATYRLTQAVWKPPLLLAVGVAVEAAVVLFLLSWTMGQVETWGDKAYPVQVDVLAGPYVALGCAAALLLVGAVQVRSLLLSRASTESKGTS